jgi:hypothetical protein
VQEASLLAAPSVTTSGTWLTSSEQPLVALIYAGMLIVAPNNYMLLVSTRNSEGDMFNKVLSGDPPISSGFTTSVEPPLELGET